MVQLGAATEGPTAAVIVVVVVTVATVTVVTGFPSSSSVLTSPPTAAWSESPSTVWWGARSLVLAIVVTRGVVLGRGEGGREGDEKKTVVTTITATVVLPASQTTVPVTPTSATEGQPVTRTGPPPVPPPVFVGMEFRVFTTTPVGRLVPSRPVPRPSAPCRLRRRQTRQVSLRLRAPRPRRGRLLAPPTTGRTVPPTPSTASGVTGQAEGDGPAKGVVGSGEVILGPSTQGPALARRVPPGPTHGVRPSRPETVVEAVLLRLCDAVHARDGRRVVDARHVVNILSFLTGSLNV